jgi:hypothetical protein
VRNRGDGNTCAAGYIFDANAQSVLAPSNTINASSYVVNRFQMMPKCKK